MNINIVIKEKENFADCVLITGFHGIGATGYISVKHMVEQLKPKRIGFIISEAMPAFVGMEEDTLVLPLEIFKKDRYVFLLPRFQPHKTEQHSLAREIVNWTIKEKFKEAILIGGLDSQFKKEEDKLCCVTTDKVKELHKIEEFNLISLNRGLYVTGILALLLAYFEINDFPALALLPYAERGRPDPRAAMNAITKINELYGLNIDVTQLLTDAELIEEEIREMLKQQEEKGKRELGGMYV
ncbi:MAG: proteasome assembly chaperone family protein [Candidatus Odinarchaeia archaeon]